MEPVFLLETTLRDGSYAVDFQFTGADTAFIVGTLAQAGISYIELCHGSGFRNEASPYRSKIRPAAIDEVHLAAAQSAAGSSKLGVITGPWAIKDFPLLVKHGFSFVRLGLLPHELLLEESFATVAAAKEAGLTVSVNLMQTTMVPVADVARAAVRHKSRGADWFYIVDSAGGMMPNKVREYVRTVREESGLVVGLHAHNNTGMALANCLAAIEAGATRVDSTLQGVGRGTGNPSTEQLLLALQSLGHESSVKLDPILRLGDLARPLFGAKGQDPTYFASGIADVHSSNVALLLKLADEKKRSGREFLVQIGLGTTRLIGIGLKSLPEEVTGPALEHTSPPWRPQPTDAAVDSLAEHMLRSSGGNLADVVDALFGAAAKVHKKSVLHLVPESESCFAAAVGWETTEYIGVTVPADPQRKLDLGDRRVDAAVIDPAWGSIDLPAGQIVRCGYRRLLADAATVLIELCAEAAGSVLLSLSDPWKTSLHMRLAEAGVALSKDASARVVVTDGTTSDGLSSLAKGTTVILLGHHARGHEWVSGGRAAGARVIRPLVGAVVAAKLASIEAVVDRLRRDTSPCEVDSLRVVDAFVAGAPDDVIVDDGVLPTRIVSAGGASRQQAARAAARLRLQSMLDGSGNL